jgi:hypothetical protein
VTWPDGRAAVLLDEPSERPIGPGNLVAPVAIPPGRGRWYLTLHNRVWENQSTWQATIIAGLPSARSRTLTQQWNMPAQLQWSMPGLTQEAALIKELETDVMAWRWDESSGADVCMFHGIVTASQDDLSEQAYTVTFTAMDYLAMLGRRYSSAAFSYNNVDQDSIAAALVAFLPGVPNLMPGGYLPIRAVPRNPDYTYRAAATGTLRVRNYTAGAQILTLLDELAKCQGGFDYDCTPSNPALGQAGPQPVVRIFFPYQGISRSDISLVYGSSVSALTRQVNSADYANYWRVIGAPPSPGTQLSSETWNADANNVGVNPIGTWQDIDNAPAVSVQATLDQQAAGDLSLFGVLTPTYQLTLRPNFYTFGNPNMGDVVPLIVKAGRLNVNSSIRVLGITYTIGDDGDENVALTVGRPESTLPGILTATNRDVAALSRR